MHGFQARSDWRPIQKQSPKKGFPSQWQIGWRTQEDRQALTGKSRSPVSLEPRLFYTSWICAAGLRPGDRKRAQLLPTPYSN